MAIELINFRKKKIQCTPTLFAILIFSKMLFIVLFSSLFACNVAQTCRYMFVTIGRPSGDFGVDPGPDPHSSADNFCNREALMYGVPNIKSAFQAGTMKFKVILLCFF